MAGPVDRTAEAALWRRWRSAAAGQMPEPAEPDALTLAAWAENRLSEADARGAEEWLAGHPEFWPDLAAARQAAQAPYMPGTEKAIARASALIAGGGEVLPFRRPAAARPRSWRVAVAWAGMAASLVVTSLVGFNLGMDTYKGIAASAPAAGVQDLLDPPVGLFNSLEEDATI
jgi:hypothetical protein